MILNDRDVDSTTWVMYAVRSAGGLTGAGRKRIFRKWLSRCHAQFDGSGSCKRTKRKASTEEFCFVLAQSSTRSATRTSLVWWSQRDLNPCFNPTTTSPLFFGGFEYFIQVRKGCDKIKHEGLRSTLEEARSCPVYVAVSQNASSR